MSAAVIDKIDVGAVHGVDLVKTDAVNRIKFDLFLASKSALL